MMRRFIFIALLIILGPDLQVAHSAPKAISGETCPKIGTTQILKKKKYTCIKLGKKLYWDNGVINTTSKKIIPATCNVVNSEWRPIFESRNYSPSIYGKILLNALILNSSIDSVATNIKVTVEWFDDIGLINRKNILIPRLYPGQSLNFGSVDTFESNSKNWPDLPLSIQLKSSCKSRAFEASELVDGTFPILKGKAPLLIEKFDSQGEIETYVKTSLILTNVFGRDIATSENFYLYGVFKDKFGNVLGGYSEILSEDLSKLEPGESGRFDIYLIDSFVNASSSIIDRMSTFDFHVIVE